MKTKFLNILLLSGCFIGFTSCNKYLDELPDNRAELNNADKIGKILTSAYPTSSYVMTAELSSDNVDDYGSTNPYSSRLSGQMFNWSEITEKDNDDINEFWMASYKAISSANAALEAIEKAGNPENLKPQRGEALVARAYNHFMLVNLFGKHYNHSTSKSDLGVTYMTKPETTLSPKYQRNTVAEVYDNVVKDLEEGIPLIDDAAYANSATAKYHFNKTAAYAFAARVYLFMGEWQKAADYASKALGDPAESLRNYAQVAAFAADQSNAAREYNSSTLKANFLLFSPYSSLGLMFGAYYTESRYNHNAVIARKETLFAIAPYLAPSNWPGIESGTIQIGSTNYRIRAYVYGGTNIDKALLPRFPYLFEFTDPVAQTGFARTTMTELTSEEALLTRAEANIHLKNYEVAIQDMQLWAGNTVTFASKMTVEGINNWGNHFAYYTPKVPTPKKKLNNPEYTIETGTQENMIHAVLFMRRIHTLHTGLRWFDIKRYGIEVYRRTLSGGTVGSVSSDVLTTNDNRRAIQLPQDVINAGLTPNPR
ncbi:MULTISPECIES: RagB/SusD family nutrient uptake outer membrane protein [unclassified Sphingobacterium]|uniref:RagB/SusD family nutrient uptake outer membrane protein n=1 Tax=unclassified Sphingobacterium TaxID=2609468 RepID=UPI0025D0ED9C|nr:MULTISPECIES: RagB/SusD family nutrient uptake outer membrane protein [unclassified Sphingobacterium]